MTHACKLHGYDMYMGIVWSDMYNMCSRMYTGMWYALCMWLSSVYVILCEWACHDTQVCGDML